MTAHRFVDSGASIWALLVWELDGPAMAYSTARTERLPNLLAVPRSKPVQFATDQPWDTFGGEETRPPWAEAASRRNEGSTTQSPVE